MNRLQILAVLCLLMAIPSGVAQQSSTNSTATNPSPSASPTPAWTPPRVVAHIDKIGPDGKKLGEIDTTTETALGETITVALSGLKEWFNDPKNKNQSPADLRLYLAGIKLTKSSPTVVSDDHVDFHLEIDPDDRQAWVLIMYDARHDPDKNGTIRLSVGPKETKQSFDSDVELKLKVYPPYTLPIIGLLVALLASTVILSARTDLLRDGANPPPPPARLPYSLGRVQMAFWFHLVIAAFLYVWLITGEYNTVTNSVLALMGISAGTGMAAALVDKQKGQEILTQRADLETQQTAVSARINDLTAAQPEPGSQLDQELQEKKNKLTEVQAQLAHSPAPPPPAVSQGFLKDILSSGQGVGFHRFQMAIWTLVFGIIFVRSVYSDLELPNFDTSLLGLMGLSSGTYVGFKVPEKR
jgi:hypothetical protein